MDARRWLAALMAESWLLADSASSDLRAPVPTCPGWDVAEALRHCGSVFHRVADVVSTGAVPAEWQSAPAPGDDLLGWYDAAVTRLVGVLTARPPGTPVFGWYPAWTQLAFWIRRMAHEVTVHRFDVQTAVGGPVAPVDEALAVDGIHEALECFLRHRGTHRGVRGQGTCVLLRVCDPGGEVTWAVRLVPDGIELAVDHPAPDARVSGRSPEVYLWLWGRLPDAAVRVDGDPAAVAELRGAYGLAVALRPEANVPGSWRVCVVGRGCCGGGGMAHTTRGLARTGLVAGMAFAFVPMIGISPAQACSCVPSDERAQFRRADAVFKGTLPPGTRTGRGDSDTVTLTFDATRAYKGTVVAEQRVKTSGSGASCGLELSGAGPWLVFATVPRDHDGTPEAVDPDDPLYEANLCGGTRAIAAGEHPAFGEGTPVERPAPDEPSGEPGGEDRGGSAYGVFGAVLAAMLAVLGGILGWGSRS